MSSSKFALFVDLENCGAKVDTLLSVLEKVKIRGDILLGKVYGYTDQYSDLKEVLLSNTFTVVPSLRYGISQKNNADILLVIDALEVAFTIVMLMSLVPAAWPFCRQAAEKLVIWCRSRWMRSSATNVPLPCLRTRSPSCTRSSMALRTVTRLTP